MQKVFLISTLILCSFLVKAQQPSHGLVHWMTIEEAEKKTKENPKPILVDIYTNWCGWCKKMIATTYSDPQVANFINQNFYPVAFDAETKDTIRFKGKTYINKEQGKKGTHELAYVFLPQSRSYPSTVFMAGDLENQMLVPGYLESKTIAPLLVFYKEKMYKEANINEFMAYFDSTFTPGNSIKIKKEVQWFTIQEALKQNLKKPKKIFVHLYTDDCISCKVMDSTSYSNPIIAQYLNDNYYPVRFDVTTKDTVEILNQKLGNPGYYHTLAQAALKNEMEFPAVLFFNEKNELISPVPQYMGPKFLEAVLVFFKKDIYLQKQFQEFMNEFNGKLN